jgi:hypothetical protein
MPESIQKITTEIYVSADPSSRGNIDEAAIALFFQVDIAIEYNRPALSPI